MLLFSLIVNQEDYLGEGSVPPSNTWRTFSRLFARNFFEELTEMEKQTVPNFGNGLELRAECVNW